jgi:hypothetical protein
MRDPGFRLGLHHLFCLVKVAFKNEESNAGEDIIPDRVQVNEIFISEKAWYAVSVQFGFGQVGLDDRIICFENDYFFL